LSEGGGADNNIFGTSNLSADSSLAIIGSSNKSFMFGSVVVGSGNKIYNSDTKVIGSNGYTSYDNEFKYTGVTGQPTYLDLSAPTNLSSSSETILWSLPMDLAGGTTWAASVVKKWGDIVKKTGAANATQYIALPTDYSPAHASNIGNYTATIQTTSEPTWTTGQFDNIFENGNLNWIAMKNTGGKNALALWIYNYPSTTLTKPYGGSYQYETGISLIFSGTVMGRIATTSAITSLVLSNSGGSFNGGTALLYGVS